MSREEIQLKLNELYKAWTPDALDDSVKMLMRIAMNHAFVFGIEIGEDEICKSNALEIIHDWEHQFDFEVPEQTDYLKDKS
jgi:hypothetical protein